MSEPDAIEVLHCRSPKTWVEAALTQRGILLSDHATCERKAAATALALIHRYLDVPELSHGLSKLAREELKHFEQVLDFMKDASVPYQRVAPGRYAHALRAFVRHDEPGRLIDLLLVAAVIEARSCERFACVRAADDGELGRFYGRFCAAEARHYLTYVGIAKRVAREDVAARFTTLLALERDLIESPDSHFRFHSGAPTGTKARQIA
jgi:tRNA-(ms[2]io[6]A)-hydroxylase